MSGKKFIWHSFSAKLLILLSIVTSIVAIGSAWSVYAVARSHQMDTVQQRLRSIALAASDFIDGDAYERLIKSGADGDADWQAVARVLKQIRSSDPDITYMYTMARRPDTDRNGIVQFGVDPETEKDTNGNGKIDRDEMAAKLGEPYDASRVPNLLAGFEAPSHDMEVSVDQWGECISGYAPIRNSAGQSVGLVGVDLMVKELRAMRKSFMVQCVLVVAAVMFTSLAVSLLLSWFINKPVKILHEAITKVSEGDLDVSVKIDTHDEFTALADAFNTMIAGLREREFIRDTLDRYMSKELAEIVIKRGASFYTAAERRRVTMLFCDLRGFTPIAEKRTPEQVVGILSITFEHMIDAVFRNKGMVDKMLGDGLMALFGTPLEMTDQEEAAVRCGIQMRECLPELRARTGIPDLDIGVGIHTGWVIAGNVGSGKIMDYTVIGDAVNVASRLESQTKEYGGGVLISQATAEPLKGLFNLTMLGPVSIRGRAEQVVVYKASAKE